MAFYWVDPRSDKRSAGNSRSERLGDSGPRWLYRFVIGLIIAAVGALIICYLLVWAVYVGSGGFGQS